MMCWEWANVRPRVSRISSEAKYFLKRKLYAKHQLLCLIRFQNECLDTAKYRIQSAPQTGHSYDLWHGKMFIW